MANKHKLPIMSRLGVIFLSWRRYQEKIVNENALTLKQYYILNQLNKKEFLNPSEIAEHLFCDRPTATVIIDNLKKYGFITKERDAKDGKRVQVRITDKGKEQLKLASESLEKKCEFDPLSCFTDQEKQTLEELLIKLSEHIKGIQ